MKPSKDTPARKFQPKNLLQLLSLCSSEWPLLLGGLLALLVASGVNLLLPEIVRRFLNSDNRSFAFEQSQSWVFLILGLFAFQALAFYLRSLFNSMLGQRVVRDLRSRLFHALIEKPMSFFDAERVGDLTSRLSSDTLLVQDALSQKISVFLRYSIQVLVGVICMFALSWKLSLLILICLPLLIALSFAFVRKLRQHSREQQAALAQTNVVAEESFSLVRTIKAFDREDHQKTRYEAKNAAVYEAGIKRSQIAAVFSSFVSFLLNVAIVLILWYGLHLVAEQKLAAGDLAAFLLYGLIVSVSFAFLTGSVAEIVQALGASERLFSWLPNQGKAANAKILSAQTSFAELQVEKGSPIVEFEKVSFSYPSRPEQEVLRKISFQLMAGERSAMVGSSGAGKTSIVAALLSLYPIQSGRILFAGRDVRSIPEEHLRAAIALVPQEPELFGESIAENIRFGRLDANQAEIVEAATKAGIHAFIESLPKGYDTLVGERGIQLSGGQRQRLAIARAIVRKPLLLILDEATSALDGLHEAAIRESVRNLGSEISVLIIAHRLASVQDADQVFVLEDGQIADQGRHSELLERGGTYQALVESQRLL